LLISIHRQLVYKEIQKTCRNSLKPRKKLLLPTDSLVIPFEDRQLVYKEIQRTCRHFLKPRKKMLPAIDLLVNTFRRNKTSKCGLQSEADARMLIAAISTPVERVPL
jgi:hypothetical protein